MIRQAISCDICGSEKKQTNHWFVAYDQSGELRISGWNSRNRLRPGSKHLCGQTCLHKLVDEFMARTIESRGPHTGSEETAEALQSILEEARPLPGRSRALDAVAVEPLRESRPAAEYRPMPEISRAESARAERAESIRAQRAESARAEEPRTDTSLTSTRSGSRAFTEHNFATDVDEFGSSARLLSPTEAAQRRASRTAPVEIIPVASRARVEEPVPLDEAPRFSSRNWRAEAWEREREREQRAVNQHVEAAPRRRSR